MKLPIRLPLFLRCLLIGCLSGMSGSTCGQEDGIPLNGLTEAEKRGGWRLLFDGTTTNGWRNYRAKGISDGWVVSNGVLERASVGAGDIVTTDQYENFELSLEYRISKGGNSGVMFHVTEDGRRPWHSGPEVQILDNVDGRDEQKSGWLYQLYQPVKPAWATQFENQVGFEGIDMDDATRPPGEWNQLYLRLSPRQSEVAMNGVSYFYFHKGDDDWNDRVQRSKFSAFPQFGKATRGHICLQDHGNAIAFRNIKIRELSADGTVTDPVDGQLPLKSAVAFPKLQWEGFTGEDDNGRPVMLRPLVLTHAGDQSNRNFVATQRGLIYVFPNSPQAERATIFLDLRDRVQDWKKDNEEGLLGLAFHPDYKHNGQFFVYYSSAAQPRTSIVSRFTVSSDDPSRADPHSEHVLMTIPQPFSNHNGGSIAFGHDGFLYIALGDGGGRNDPLGHGQNLSTWMGSLLRIDVDHQDEGKAYAIPADNPFLERPHAQPEIYAYGFRNIWRLSVDRLTGDIWAADVGQDFWEEINLLQSGGNYGWSVREASWPFNNKSQTVEDQPVRPIWEYDHQLGKSITGGYVYRGNRVPELQGMYVFADFISGKIWAIQYDAQSKKVTRNYSLPSTGMPVLAFGEDEVGDVYHMIETINGKGIFRFEHVD